MAKTAGDLVVDLRGRRHSRGSSALVAVLVVMAVLLQVHGYTPVGPSAPGIRSASAQSYPGWMTPEQAALFTNEWPALVPSYVPEPFASVVPSISIDGGYYRLYWFVGGGAPTFLDVRGYLNGYIPAGSAYDLNVELKINSAVRGNEAYHDPTPIYDAVYWREGGPSYWANSQGLSTDIVSYANSFTNVAAPVLEPTATVSAPAPAPAPAVLYSPDSVSSGGAGTVTAIGGGAEATLVADGGFFPDTGTASYPGAGDAAVSWMAPEVMVDTIVTFSLLDANDAVLMTTPTLVTAAEAPGAFSVMCPPTAAAGELLSVSVTGSGNVILDASTGSWPQTSPNTDYDPGGDGSTLAFTLGDGGAATLSWSAPDNGQTAIVRAYGPSGMVVGSCQADVLGEIPTTEPTAPLATSTTAATVPPAVPATSPGNGAVTVPAPTTAVPVQATATSMPTSPGTTAGDGTDPGSGVQPTVPGTGSGDGIDTGVGSSPAPTARSGDGTDLVGQATVPPDPTYPAIPTSAPLPDAPPTSVPPTGDGATVPGQTPQVMTPGTTATIAPTRTVPTATGPAPTATSASSGASISVPAAPPTQVPARATNWVVAPTSTLVPTSAPPPAPATATSTIGPPTVVPTTAAPTAQPTTVPPTATVVQPTAIIVQPAATSPEPTATRLVSTATVPAATATVLPPTATVGVPLATATFQPTPTTLPASPASTSTPPVPTPTETESALATALPPVTATTTPTTPTSTVVPPTATTVPATATTVPPTATAVPAIPTPTPLPATPQPTQTATVALPTATATRRAPATATATPIRAGQDAQVAGALASSPAATTVPTVSPTAPPVAPTVPRPTPTAAQPQTVTNVTQEIGPAGGTLQHPAGAGLEIGSGVFDSMMMVSMAQVPDAQLPVSPDVDLIPTSGYDIEITGVDGQAVTTLPAGVVLRLNVPEDVRDDAVVYWIDGGELTQLGVTNEEESGISAPLPHLSRYVAGVPIDENPKLGWLPWAVAIAAGISCLLIVGLLVNQSRRQRRWGMRVARTS